MFVWVHLSITVYLEVQEHVSKIKTIPKYGNLDILEKDIGIFVNELKVNCNSKQLLQLVCFVWYCHQDSLG